MAAKRLSMRKTKEILRLKLEVGLSNRKVAEGSGVGRTTVSDYAKRAKRAGLDWAEIESLSEAELNRRLFPPLPESKGGRPRPDLKRIHRELKKKSVTLALLWDEYKVRHPDGYQYSYFCDLYRDWIGRVDPVMRQSHKAGEKVFVDYAGQTVGVIDPYTGEVREAQVFVAVLGASSYTYAEATWSQGLPDFTASHVRAFEYFGGVPEIAVIDNLRSGVSKACRYEPDINPTYQDLATHYGLAVIPARVRKPKDKAKAEVGVQVVERWILAALRNRTFFSLAELNETMRELLERINERPFKKLDGSRRSMFESLEQSALKPLPKTPYQYAEWKKAKVNIDYHVELERHRYSVPHRLIGRRLEIRHTKTTVECFLRGERVAVHPRKYQPGGFTTVPEHMPRSHREFARWTPERIINWMGEIGPSAAKLAREIIQARPHPHQGFRSCLGIIGLSKGYPRPRVEAACKRALAINALTYKSIKSILKNNLDSKQLPQAEPDQPALFHDNIRGGGYYASTREAPNAG